MKLKLKFPYLRSFGDYHDIKYHCDDLNDVFVARVKCKEVAFHDGKYWGLFYIGKLPSKKQLKIALIRSGLREIASNWA